jgi:hypothetical protein
MSHRERRRGRIAACDDMGLSVARRNEGRLVGNRPPTKRFVVDLHQLRAGLFGHEDRDFLARRRGAPTRSLSHGAGVATGFAACGWLYSSTRLSIATIMLRIIGAGKDWDLLHTREIQ